MSAVRGFSTGCGIGGGGGGGSGGGGGTGMWRLATKCHRALEIQLQRSHSPHSNHGSPSGSISQWLGPCAGRRRSQRHLHWQLLPPLQLVCHFPASATLRRFARLGTQAVMELCGAAAAAPAERGHVAVSFCRPRSAGTGLGVIDPINSTSTDFCSTSTSPSILASINHHSHNRHHVSHNRHAILMLRRCGNGSDGPGMSGDTVWSDACCWTGS